MFFCACSVDSCGPDEQIHVPADRLNSWRLEGTTDFLQLALEEQTGASEQTSGDGTPRWAGRQVINMVLYKEKGFER